MDIFRSQLCILILCCLVSVHGSDENTFTVQVSPPYAAPHIGANQTLQCQYNISENVNHLRVKWLKQKEDASPTLIWTAEANTETLHNKAEQDYVHKLSGSPAAFGTLLQQHSLTFINVQKSDAGLYFCQVVFNLTTTADSPKCTLKVQVSIEPALSVLRQDATFTADIEEGKDMIVDCSFPMAVPTGGAFSVTILNGSNLILCEHPMNIPGTLIFCQHTVKFNRHDNYDTDWSCLAVIGGLPYQSSAKQLDVKFPALHLLVTKPFPSELVNEGSRVNMTCETGSANPQPDVNWSRNTIVIHMNEMYTITASQREGDYYGWHSISMLSFIATQEHKGSLFACMIQGQDPILTNSSVLSLKDHLPVQIQGYDGPTEDGDGLNLTCTVGVETGIAPAFSWTFTANGQTHLISESQTYQKANINSSDFGDYTCEASTSWSIGRDTIIVGPTQEPDVVSSTQQSTEGQTVLETDSGESVQDGGNKSSKIPVIAGAAAGGAVFLLLLLIIVLVIMKRKNKESKENELMSISQTTENEETSTQDRTSPPNGPTAPPMIEAGYATIGEPANHTTETAKGSEQATTNPPDAAMIDNIGYASIGESSNQTAEDLKLGEAADGLTAVPIADMGYSSIGDVATYAPTPVNCLGKKVQDVSQTKVEQNAGPEEKNLSPAEVEALYAKPDQMSKSKGKQNEKDGVAQEQKKTQTAAADAKPTVAVKPMKTPPGVGQKPRKRSTGLSLGQSEPQKSHEYDNVVPAAHQKSPPPKTSATNEGPYAVVAPPTGTGAPPRPKVKETTYSAVKLRSRNTAVDTDSD